jgi:hypothetical protein
MGMSLKRFAGICLTAVLVASVSACGGGGSSGAGQTAADPPPITPSSNADLVELSLSAIPLDQTFQASQLSYTASVNFLTFSTAVTPTADLANATVMVNNAAVISGAARDSIALSEGLNTIAVVVTAEDGSTTNTYTIEATVQSAEDFPQQAYIKASNAAEGDEFGRTVALSGDTLAVVSLPAEAVYVFTRDNGIWVQEAYLSVPVSSCGFCLGPAISLWGDTLAVGAPFIDGGSGAVYVFTRGNGTWRQEAVLKGSNTEGDSIEESGFFLGDQFGASVALSGNTLAVGAVGEGSSTTGGEDDNSELGAGAVYVFTRDNGSWNQSAFLKAFNAEGSYDIGMGFLSGDEFGRTVALSGDTLAAASGLRAVHVFRHTNGVWNQEDFLESVGIVIALYGDDLAVGAPSSTGGTVSVFTRSSGTWAQQAYLEAPNGGITEYPKDFSCGSFIPPDNFSQKFGDNFGVSLALSADTLVVGAPNESSSATGGEADNSTLFAGAVYVFTRSKATWKQELFLKAWNADGGCTWSGTGIPTWGGDEFGQSVALSGSVIAVGAPQEDSSASGGESDNFASSAGAVYTFP